jgi:hypothetical protein
MLLPYRELVESLNWADVRMWLDIATIIGMLSQ